MRSSICWGHISADQGARSAEYLSVGYLDNVDDGAVGSTDGVDCLAALDDLDRLDELAA